MISSKQREETVKEKFSLSCDGSAASSIAGNYDLVVKEFGGCATPILKGHPVSGKATSLKAVVSVFGQSQLSSGKYLSSTY